MPQINDEYVKFYVRQLFDLYEGWLELRYIPTDRSYSVNRDFFKTPANPQQIIDSIYNHHFQEIPYHVYLGVNLRSQKQSKEQYIKMVNTFFVDMDAKDYEGGKNEAREIINNFSLSPTFVTDSGHGFHCYFVLEEPFPINHRGSIEEAKQVSIKLHRELGGDDTYDLSRILRVPGSVNVKERNNYVLCQYESISFETYRFNQLKDVLPNGQVKASHNINLNLNGDSDINSIEDLTEIVPLDILKRAKNRPDKFCNDRSANDFYVAIRLFESGLSDTEIVDAFKLFAKKEWDAGLKVKETGEQYIQKTVSSAKASYEERNNLTDGLGNINIVTD